MTDSLPPMTVAELHDILKNPNFKTYVVLGKSNDKAWMLALAAQSVLPGVRSYLVKSSVQAAVRQKYNVPSRHVGVVFGRSTQVKATLTRKKAEDFLTVINSITDA